MKINPGKSNCLIYRNKVEQVWAEIGENKIWETRAEILLCIIMDSNLNSRNISILIKRESYPRHVSTVH